MIPGEVRYVWFPFSHTEPKPYKKRPVLILAASGSGPDRTILAAMVTSSSKRIASLTSGDVLIHDWSKIGLVAPSVVRSHRLWSAEDRDFDRLLGRVQDSVLAQVRRNVLTLLGP
jgi:hypothetical protein